MKKIEELEALREAYQQIRADSSAIGMTINTTAGDLSIENKQVVVNVLDFLIHDVNEQIKQEILKQ